METLAANLTGSRYTSVFQFLANRNDVPGMKRFIFSGVTDGSYELEQYSDSSWSTAVDLAGDEVDPITTNGVHSVGLPAGYFRFSVSGESGLARIVVDHERTLLVASVA